MFRKGYARLAPNSAPVPVGARAGNENEAGAAAGLATGRIEPGDATVGDSRIGTAKHPSEQLVL